MVFESMINGLTPLIQRILQHPFNDALAKGTLSQQKFLAYLQQDTLYLRDFSKALALVSARLPSIFSGRILKLALGAVEAEQKLHESYLSAYEITELPQKNPACFAYTHYLLSLATLGCVEEALASLVPCFWIYKIVGQHVAERCVVPNPFYPWIAAYSSPSFEEAVNEIILVMNHLAENASSEGREKMHNAFKCATELEWLFWEDAYQNTLTLSQRIGV
jgi:thiaminase (transcriptional activator TenA)